MRIDYEDAVLLLKQIVADRGEDWVYPNMGICPECNIAGSDECEWHYAGGCRYFTASGKPACIVGEFISRTVDPFDYNVHSIEAENAATVLHYLSDVLQIDERTEHLLITAQGEQDTNASWGDALATAIHAANRFTK